MWGSRLGRDGPSGRAGDSLKLASARSSQLLPGEGKSDCSVRNGRMLAFLRERQKSGLGRRRRAGWEWLTLASKDAHIAEKLKK